MGYVVRTKSKTAAIVALIILASVLGAIITTNLAEWVYKDSECICK